MQLNDELPPWKRFDKTAKELEREFLELLDQNHVEQVYQTFIEQNTRLVPREFLKNHGINFHIVIRKLAIGADYKPDFMYLSKSSVTWNCILVEIERPDSRYFKDSTPLEFHPDFLKGLQQIDKWRAWFLEPSNYNSFCNSTIGTMRVPMTENPVEIKYVLVTGRRSERGGSALKRRMIAAKEAHDFRIMSFDSLAEDLDSKSNLYLGVRKNEYIDIISDSFLNESIFSWMEPSNLRITHAMKADIEANRSHWFHLRTFKKGEKGPQYAMDQALKEVRVRSS